MHMCKLTALCFIGRSRCLYMILGSVQATWCVTGYPEQQYACMQATMHTSPLMALRFTSWSCRRCYPEQLLMVRRCQVCQEGSCQLHAADWLMGSAWQLLSSSRFGTR